MSVVVPCFNEEVVLPTTARRLEAEIRALIERNLVAADSAAWFVDDGSSDRTWATIEALASVSPRVHGIRLAGNRGHQNALLAGLVNAPGDVVISMDADLQDDVGAMGRMLALHAQGCDVVYGVRSARRADSAFKRFTAELYYKLLRAMGVDLVYNHADYRLMSRKAVDALARYRETNLFLRGLVPTLGLRSGVVEYERAARAGGESKYPLRKMLAFAWNGVTSFSNVPLRLITALGLVTAFLSTFLLVWVLYVRFATDDAVPGWASVTLPLFFLGGVQLLSIGMIGEYVAKMYLETKDRPRFIVERTV